MQAKPDLGFHLKSYQDRYFRSILKRAAVESMRARPRRGRITPPGGKVVGAGFVFPHLGYASGATLLIRWKRSLSQPG